MSFVFEVQIYYYFYMCTIYFIIIIYDDINTKCKLR